MFRVTSRDYNFFKMVSYIQEPPEKISDLVQAIQAFRSRLSLKWVEQFLYEEPENCLASVWMTLFTLSTHEDPTVRINTYNAIGALIFSLTPFVPVITMKSFCIAVSSQSIQLTSTTSIAIISSFLYISHSISPSELEQFVTSAPVLYHFSVDISEFIQHIPKMIPLMEPLGEQFQQPLLRSLLTSFGRNPNHHFVLSVAALVSLNPQPLLSSLMEFVLSNKLNQAILSLGPHLLANSKIFPLIQKEYIQHFINVALEILHTEQTNMNDFEQACGTLSVIVEHLDGDEYSSFLAKIEDSKLSQYPKHFQRLLLQLPTQYDKLIINTDDQNSLKCAKLRAIAKFVMKDNSEATCKSALLEFEKCAESTGDVFTTLIQCLADIFDLLIGSNDQLLARIISSILFSRNRSWIQDSAVLKLLKSIDLDDGSKLIHGYEKLAIDLTLSFAMAPHDELAEQAADLLAEYATYDSINEIIMFLQYADIFATNSTMRYVYILNSLLDHFPRSYFKPFAEIVTELIIIHENQVVVGEAFRFLYRCDHFNVSQEVVNTAIDWICRMYRSMTQNEPIVTSPLKNKDPLQNLITTVETDVVANNIIDQKDSMLPLFYCYQYFAKYAKISNHISMSFAQQLVRLFPDQIIKMSPTIYVKRTPEFNEFAHIVSNIFTTESSFNTAAVCCDLLCDATIEERMSVKETVISLMKNPKLTNGENIYSFYKFLHITDTEKSGGLLEEASKRARGIDEILLNLCLDKLDQETFAKFAESTDFNNWPLKNKLFLDYIENKNTIKIKISNFDILDDKHWNYYIQHAEKFETQQFEEYKATHRHKIARYIPHENVRTFKVDPIPTDVTKDASILPSIINNSYVHNESLASYFFINTKYKITQEQFNFIVSQITSTSAAINALNYSYENGIKLAEETILNLIKIENPEVRRLLARQIYKTEQITSQLDQYKTSPLSCQEFTFTDLYYALDQDEFLKSYQSSFKVKSSNVLKLCYLIRLFNFSMDSLMPFIQSLIDSIDSNTSAKRTVSILRVTHLAVSMFYKSIPVEFMQKLNTKLAIYLNCDISIIYKEISSIFEYTFPVAKPIPQLIAMCDAFDKLAYKSSVFIVPQTLAYAKHLIGSTRINKAGYVDQLLSEIPSIKIHALKSVQLLFDSSQGWAIFYSMFSTFSAVFSEKCTTPLICPILAQMANQLLSNIFFDKIQKDYISHILPKLFSQPNLPWFNDLTMPTITFVQKFNPPGSLYTKFVDGILNTKPYDPKASQLYRFYASWLYNNERSTSRKSDILLEEIQVLTKMLATSPSMENVVALVDALKLDPEGYDPVFILIGKLAKLPIPYIYVILLVNEFIKRSKEDEVSSCKELFESVADTFQNQQYSEALRLVLDRKPLEAVIIATSL